MYKENDSLFKVQINKIGTNGSFPFGGIVIGPGCDNDAERTLEVYSSAQISSHFSFHFHYVDCIPLANS